MTPRLFDAGAFGRRLAERRAANAQSLRQAADAAGVSVATFTRVEGGWDHLSHENYLRLEAWLAAGQARSAA